MTEGTACLCAPLSSTPALATGLRRYVFPAALRSPPRRVEGARAAGHINTAFDFLKQRLIAIRKNSGKASPRDTEKPSAKITSNYLSYYKLLISALVSARVSVQVHLTMFHCTSPYSLMVHCAFRQQMAGLWESDCVSFSLRLFHFHVVFPSFL